MPYDDDPRKELVKNTIEGKKEEKFSFLQETIKPEPLTRKKLFQHFMKLAVYGVMLGMFACLGFYALKPWVQSNFPGAREEVTIPEDEVVDEQQADASEEPVEAAQRLDAQSYEEMMDSVYAVAAESEKSTATIRPKVNDWAEDSSEQYMGNTGLIAADNGQELLILTDNSVCADAVEWTITFSDGSQYPVELKRQDKNSGLAVFSISKAQITSTTWNYVQVAELGNSNIVAKGDVVIALGEMFGYPDGAGYGIVSSDDLMKNFADHTFGIIATDIAVVSGGSGILCNMDGEVIGLIDSAIWKENESNTANAYAISDLKALMEQLLNGKKVPYTGICGVSVDEQIASEQGIPEGLYITQIQPDSPAMSAGIQNGDVIQEISGTPVTTMASYEKIVQESQAGQDLKVEGKRLGADGYVDISFHIIVGSLE